MHKITQREPVTPEQVSASMCDACWVLFSGEYGKLGIAECDGGEQGAVSVQTYVRGICRRRRARGRGAGSARGVDLEVTSAG